MTCHLFIYHLLVSHCNIMIESLSIGSSCLWTRRNQSFRSHPEIKFGFIYLTESHSVICGACLSALKDVCGNIWESWRQVHRRPPLISVTICPLQSTRLYCHWSVQFYEGRCQSKNNVFFQALPKSPKTPHKGLSEKGLNKVPSPPLFGVMPESKRSFSIVLPNNISYVLARA